MAYMSAVQWYLTLLNFLFIFFLGTVTYSPILTLFTPDHFCRVEELQNMTREARRSLAIPRHPDTGRYTLFMMDIAPDSIIASSLIVKVCTASAASTM